MHQIKSQIIVYCFAWDVCSEQLQQTLIGKDWVSYLVKTWDRQHNPQRQTHTNTYNCIHIRTHSLGAHSYTRDPGNKQQEHKARHKMPHTHTQVCFTYKCPLCVHCVNIMSNVHYIHTMLIITVTNLLRQNLQLKITISWKQAGIVLLTFTSYVHMLSGEGKKKRWRWNSFPSSCL